MAADQGRGPGGQGRAGGFRADRLAEDLRVARHAHLRPDPAALGVRRGAPRRGRGGAGDRAAGARAGHVQVVEGRAARRLRGLQPERQGPHGRLRLFHPPGPRRPGIRAADLGGGALLRSGGLHHRHRPGAVRSDRRPVGGDGRGGRVAGRAARAGGQGRGGGPARRAVAAALREADRRGPPGAAVQAPQRRVRVRSGSPGARQAQRAHWTTAEHQAADRDRARGQQGRGDGGPGTLEGDASRGMAEARAGRRPGRLDARPQLELVPDPAQPAARPGIRTPAARAPGSRLRPLGRGSGPDHGERRRRRSGARARPVGILNSTSTQSRVRWTALRQPA